MWTRLIQISNSRNATTLATQIAPEVCQKISRPSNKGRGECRVPNAPAASCALRVVSMRTSIHSGGTGNTRHSPRNGFTAYSALSSGTTCFVDPVIRATRWRLANLTPAKGRQNHTASPSATKRSSHAPPRPPHPTSRVRDDREPPLLARQDGESETQISEKRK